VNDEMRPRGSELGRILGLLKEEVGDTAYRSWLRSLRLERIDAGEAVVAAPTGFLRNWVETHYADRLLALWQAENPSVQKLSLIVDAAVAAMPETAPAAASIDLAETGGSPEVADDR
jgi:chromosomal replication initiator protein